MSESFYQGCCMILTTKHAKSIALAPPFLEKLGASVLEYVVDTDKLGTFSGEVEREGNALECARKKCEWSLNTLGDKVEFALASEGSFGPHPLNPFLPCNHEILYFIDRKRGFHLHLSHISLKTNFRAEAISSLEALFHFAEQVSFPSHALVLRPDNRQTKGPIFKGLDCKQSLAEAFNEALQFSENGKVWVETDMRAHCNPSRMEVIKELATEFSQRLLTLCPSCNSPGWGQVRNEKGLPCSGCGTETELVKSQIFGCVKCNYFENKPRTDGKKEADPENCSNCNP